jgi:hypothetical protein
MSKYICRRNKISEIMEKQIIPAIKHKDLDFHKVKNYLISQTGCAETMAEEVILECCLANKIKEVRVLTLPDEKVDEFIKELQEIEKTREEADKRMEEISHG